MIKSFKHKGLKKYYDDGGVKGIQAKHADKLGDILDFIDAASKIGDINFPGSDLHRLSPREANIWAVKVFGAWRVTFKLGGSVNCHNIRIIQNKYENNINQR